MPKFAIVRKARTRIVYRTAVTPRIKELTFFLRIRVYFHVDNRGEHNFCLALREFLRKINKMVILIVTLRGIRDLVSPHFAVCEMDLDG